MNWKERIEDATRKRAKIDADEAKQRAQFKAEEAERKLIEKNRKRQEADVRVEIQRLENEERRKTIVLLEQELAEKKAEAIRQLTWARETLKEFGVPSILKQINKGVWKGLGSVSYNKGVFKGSIVAPKDNPRLETTHKWPEWQLKFRYDTLMKEGYSFHTYDQVPEMRNIAIPYGSGNPPIFESVPTGRTVTQRKTHHIPAVYEKHEMRIGIAAKGSHGTPLLQLLQRLIISIDEPPYPIRNKSYTINVRSSEPISAEERMKSILADFCVYQIENQKLPSDILKQPKNRERFF